MELDDLKKIVKHHLNTAEYLREVALVNAGGALTHNSGYWSGYCEAISAIYSEMTKDEEPE